MNPKLSIIIPVAGNDQLRNRNFEQCIKCILNQNFLDYEVIIVEQSLDNNYYKSAIEKKGFKWIGIKDPHNRGFNLSWCRNVGAKNANGEKLVLMDADMVFESEYFNRIIENKEMFAGGASKYHWISQESITEGFVKTKDFNWIYNYGLGRPKDYIFRFEPFSNGCGYGAILIFNREWYWNIFGGYPEDFFRYGWEDKAAVEIIKGLLNISEDKDLSKIDYEVIHLSHFSKDSKNMKKNEEIYKKIKMLDKKDLSKKIKLMNLGEIDSPKIINI